MSCLSSLSFGCLWFLSRFTRMGAPTGWGLRGQPFPADHCAWLRNTPQLTSMCLQYVDNCGLPHLIYGVGLLGISNNGKQHRALLMKLNQNFAGHSTLGRSQYCYQQGVWHRLYKDCMVQAVAFACLIYSLRSQQCSGLVQNCANLVYKHQKYIFVFIKCSRASQDIDTFLILKKN